MITFEEIRTLQLEVTNRCQASCPMCPRNYHGGKDNPNLLLGDWTLADYKHIINQEVLDQVEEISFCGNFGDPIINRDLLEMCEYTAAKAPNISLRIHTNGSARPVNWWTRLAQVLPGDSIVVFGIDGLEDTHHIYRIGTKYETIIRNASAFIQAGGTAEWAFIKFKHNQHQVEQARAKAKEIGFEMFSVKTSNRFIKDTFEVVDKHGEVEYYLEPADDSVMTTVTEESFRQLDSWAETVDITCAAQHNKEMYIDANRRFFPCCFTASLPYFYSEHGDVIHETRHKFFKQYQNLVEAFGGIDTVNTTKHTIREIVENPNWNQVWEKFWAEQKLTICAKVCGVSKKKMFNNPGEQYTVEDNLKDPS